MSSQNIYWLTSHLQRLSHSPYSIRDSKNCLKYYTYIIIFIIKYNSIDYIAGGHEWYVRIWKKSGQGILADNPNDLKKLQKITGNISWSANILANIQIGNLLGTRALQLQQTTPISSLVMNVGYYNLNI